jgi:hypothetical protein
MKVWAQRRCVGIPDQYGASPTEPAAKLYQLQGLYNHAACKVTAGLIDFYLFCWAASLVCGMERFVKLDLMLYKIFISVQMLGRL